MRETKPVTVPEFPGTRNRDRGKRFLITEWPARRAADWMWRMILAANRDGGVIPMDMRGIGKEGIAVLFMNTFLRGNIKSEEILPLWDQLLECVQAVRDPARPDIATALVDGDVEEVATLEWLRLEVLSVHVNFSVLDSLWSLWTSILEKTSEGLPSAPTSAPSSATSS